MSLNRASLLYGTNVNFGTPLAQEPRVKYQYTIDFILNSSDWENLRDSLNAAGIRNPEFFKEGEFKFRAQTVELPSHTYSVQTLNQYNRKRVVMTDIQYNPITLTFHDTKDSYLENLVRAYNLYYFGNLEKPVRTYNLDTIPASSSTVDDIDILPGEPGDNTATGYGYKPPTENSDKYFFKQININREYGNANPYQQGYPVSNKQLLNKKANLIIDQISIINPMLTTVTHDNLSYADSSPLTWSLNFMYEAVEYGNLFRNKTTARPQGIPGFADDIPSGDTTEGLAEGQALEE